VRSGLGAGVGDGWSARPGSNAWVRPRPEPDSVWAAGNLSAWTTVFCIRGATTALNGEQLLEVFLRGVLGRSGRKRSGKAVRFLGGQGGFLTASTVMAAVGVAWGLYDSLKNPAAAERAAAGAPPLLMPPEVARIVRLAASAAGADGTVADGERALILEHARQAGVESLVDEALGARRPLAEIVAGVTEDAERRDLYVLAVAVVRADESISGAERIYLAQLAHVLGLDAATAAALEQQTATAIDGASGLAPQAP